ncbi:hypothetical protein [Halococcus sp. PRR34]|uniref:hypothetical protein n=1 Tax=Halococcus sp. PRR34 TaxID=3020830 RepID=UPI0023610C2B|nr:hypothetical protein [Halococcus sp. PRR34]
MRQLLATHPVLAAPSGGSHSPTVPNDSNADPSNVGEAGGENREPAAWLRSRGPA